jgi:hypothetical protein
LKAKIPPGGKPEATTRIVSRLLARTVTMNLALLDPDIPPPAVMDGVDLVTEGTVTLGKVVEMLERGNPGDLLRKNPATDLISLMLQSDIVQFVVGTRINKAHQDPNVPVELDHRPQNRHPAGNPPFEGSPRSVYLGLNGPIHTHQKAPPNCNVIDGSFPLARRAVVSLKISPDGFLPAGFSFQVCAYLNYYFS